MLRDVHTRRDWGCFDVLREHLKKDEFSYTGHNPFLMLIILKFYWFTYSILLLLFCQFLKSQPEGVLGHF